MNGAERVRADRRMHTRAFEHHHESSGIIGAPIHQVFTFIDDPARLAGHMTRSSWMMGGGRMQVQMDNARGQRTGSRIVMTGRAFGFELELEEIIDERTPPMRKAWHTVGAPSLVVMGSYRMGCDLAPEGDATRLRVFIDYGLPERQAWLGRICGRWYARWCTQRMLSDCRRHFARGEGTLASATI